MKSSIKNYAFIFLTVFIFSAAIKGQEQQPEQRIELLTRFSAKITKEDMRLLFVDVNPAALKAAAENAEFKKATIENFKELFAVAIQAVKEGFADSAETSKELKDIRSIVTATTYDCELNERKTNALPFSLISEDRVREFYAQPENEKRFDDYLENKIKLAKTDGAIAANFKLTDEQTAQAKSDYAKINIYEREAAEKAEALGAEFNRRVALQVKLQQAQYLARLYTNRVLAGKSEVTEEDVQKYVAEHPALNPKILQAKAAWILLRAKAGEDFAKLAAEFTDDPGSKETGGLFENVKKGLFIAEFEQAALSLEVGTIYPELVETKYGYHIIKLEKVVRDAGGKDVETYDVRHILFSTEIPDPQTPFVKMSLREKVKNQKEKNFLAEIKSKNPVEVEDFEIPTYLAVDLADEKTFPARLKSYLDENYAGWKLAPSKEGCGSETNSGIVTGDFNDDAKTDYAVKFTRGEKGYIIAFVVKEKDFKAFVLHDYTADEADNAALGIYKKGEIYETDEKSFRLKRDAPSDYRCESDVGGAHLYKRGKFKAL